MKINEIFYSLQGEGYHTGKAAVFVRLSGCNLRCPFCDTDHTGGTDMTEEDIVRSVTDFTSRHVVITGGEPSLQITDSLIDKLHKAGCFVQIETNGTMPLPEAIDWVTCSPKEGKAPVLRNVDELKIVMVNEDTDPAAYDHIHASHRFLQPCDHGDPAMNAATMELTVDYIKHNPKWRLSLQTHKLINIP